MPPKTVPGVSVLARGRGSVDFVPPRHDQSRPARGRRGPFRLLRGVGSEFRRGDIGPLGGRTRREGQRLRQRREGPGSGFAPDHGTERGSRSIQLGLLTGQLGAHFRHRCAGPRRVGGRRHAFFGEHSGDVEILFRVRCPLPQDLHRILGAARRREGRDRLEDRRIPGAARTELGRLGRPLRRPRSGPRGAEHVRCPCGGNRTAPVLRVRRIVRIGGEELLRGETLLLEQQRKGGDRIVRRKKAGVGKERGAQLRPRRSLPCPRAFACRARFFHRRGAPAASTAASWSVRGPVERLAGGGGRGGKDQGSYSPPRPL